MKVMPDAYPKLRLDIELFEWAFGNNAQAAQQYWGSVSTSFEMLISDILCERPDHIGDFVKDWLSQPQRQSLLTPSALQATQIKIGDAVMAFFFGEWHPAMVHGIDGTCITVLWESEWSTSKVPITDIAPRASDSTVATMAEQLDAQAMEGTCQDGAVHVLENAIKASPDNPSDVQKDERGLQQPTWSERLAADSKQNAATANTTHSRQANSPASSASSSLTSVSARSHVEAKPDKSVAVVKSGCTETAVHPEVRAFIAANALDEDAVNVLLKASPEIQRFVIRRGCLNTAKNPSAALQARVREAFTVLQTSEKETGGSISKRVEVFLKENAVDERAATALRTAKPNVQEEAINRGDLVAVKNPSGALMGRIAAAQKKK